MSRSKLSAEVEVVAVDLGLWANCVNKSALA